jgi:hypothetical protein
MFNLEGTYALDESQRIGMRFAQHDHMRRALEFADKMKGVEADSNEDDFGTHLSEFMDSLDWNDWYKQIGEEMKLLEPYWDSHPTKQEAVAAYYRDHPCTRLVDMTWDLWRRLMTADEREQFLLRLGEGLLVPAENGPLCVHKRWGNDIEGVWHVTQLSTGFPIFCFLEERADAVYLAQQAFDAAPTMWAITNEEEVKKKMPRPVQEWCFLISKALQKRTSVRILQTYKEFSANPSKLRKEWGKS